jgi:hypothetical protein
MIIVLIHWRIKPNASAEVNRPGYRGGRLV